MCRRCYAHTIFIIFLVGISGIIPFTPTDQQQQKNNKKKLIIDILTKVSSTTTRKWDSAEASASANIVCESRRCESIKRTSNWSAAFALHAAASLVWEQISINFSVGQSIYARLDPLWKCIIYILAADQLLWCLRTLTLASQRLYPTMCSRAQDRWLNPVEEKKYLDETAARPFSFRNQFELHLFFRVDWTPASERVEL